MTENHKSSQLLPSLKRLWLHGFALGVGIILIGLVVWFFITGGPSSPTSPLSEPAPPVQPQASKSPAADRQVSRAVPDDSAALLKSQLQQVISELREAHQKKDLSKLLSYYSSNFPGLPQRTQSISKAWRIYDYPKIDVEIEEVKLFPDHSALARVKWDAEAKNINTQKSINSSKTYLIRFVQESGQWRIRALETVK